LNNRVIFPYPEPEICALLGYYAAYNGNSLPTFRDNIAPIFKGQEIQEIKHLS